MSYKLNLLIGLTFCSLVADVLSTPNRPAGVQLGETCLVNSTKLNCLGHGVDINCKNKTCACLSGFEPSADNNKTCVPKTRKVGEECSVDSDCGTAYSECASGKCACIKDFDEIDKICKPKSYNCPFGNVTFTSSKVVLCTIKAKTNKNDTDPCSKGSFCFTHPDVKNNNDDSIGHCCPQSTKLDIPKQYICPVGSPHTSAKCCVITNPDGPLPEDCQPYCPLETHTCQQSYVCCPLPCRRNITGFFSVNNICYDRSVLGQQCDVNPQCITNAICKGDKKRKTTCQCDDGYETKNNFTCISIEKKTPQVHKIKQ